MFNILKQKIQNKKAKVGVIGLGYVGLPLAISFAKAGFFVLGIDKDINRINRIKKRIPYILDVSIKDIDSVVRVKRFVPTIDFTRLKELDAIIICVPTPLKRKTHPDISYIVDAVRQISKNLRRGQLIILESTTYPGTTEEVILPMLEKSGLKCKKDFYLSFSPERIDPGNEKYKLSNVPKIVGAVGKDAQELTKLLYRTITNQVVAVSSPKVAETVKLLENTFRIVNIGLVNELAMMCNKMNIDIWEVIDAAKTKPFGFMPFYPGPGVGGSCIPKDPLYLYWRAKKYGFETRFIKLASWINSSMPNYIIERLKILLKENGKLLKDSKILIIGVTYKKDIKDLRKSPAIEIIDLLQKNKAKVLYHDPYIPYLKINRINLKSTPLSATLLRNIDCTVIVTDHGKLNYNLIANYSRLIFDTRNALKDTKTEKGKLVKL